MNIILMEICFLRKSIVIRRFLLNHYQVLDRTITYTYDTTAWKDKLLNVKDNTSQTLYNFTYDLSGNPLSDGNYTYTWNGKELIGASNSDQNIIYQYNVNGIRTNKKILTTTSGIYDEYNYYIDGDKIINETIDNHIYNILISSNLHFTYDAGGTLISMNYDDDYNDSTPGTEYFYVRDIQGNVIALTDKDGKIVVEYRYDSWGNIISTSDATGIDLAKLNPFRYRSYYYDEETGYYYLNSRYYNPEIGRFINADGQLNDDILGKNMYIYANSNPVMNSDPTGRGPCSVDDDVENAFNNNMGCGSAGGERCWRRGS